MASSMGLRAPTSTATLDSLLQVASPTPMSSKKRTRRKFRLLLATATIGVAAYGAAYRFALRYRERVGLPHRSPVEMTPDDFGLAYESVEIPSGHLRLAGWFVPATADAGAAGKRRPGIIIVHGWESNRGRTFAHVRYLHAAGFHCLVFDVRGHGDSPSETLPINVPEFADDAAAAVRWLAARPEVSAVGVLGHSMGGAGVIVAASKEPLIRAAVSLSAPADLVRMTRKTFTMAEMHIPRPIAGPLALITAAVLMAPRRHSIDDASALVAARRYRGPLLLIHGAEDHGVPVEHLELIAQAAAGARGSEDPPVETLVLPEFGHRWLYEAPEFRRRVARFFAAALGGPVSPKLAGERAEACVVERPPDPVYGFGSLPARLPPG
jgi:alpha-beta hydrolase superfamily lysophospholipase